MEISLKNFYVDILLGLKELSHYPTEGVGGGGAGTAICQAFHPKEPAQDSWTDQELRFQLLLTYRIT